ncbi:hypothetical protein ILUMI_20008 [Ignelater luminosus]|uniref:Uncharacterized protein n=1 Tax=Ignelater luminosus TaxID=2038154 RepID=A0A8K0CLS5_IGNLU|nr:hypothetical protein ILUMI_20008 [Ignelater luminosus]
MEEQLLLSDMKNRFNNRLIELISTKGQNTQIFTEAVYLEMKQEVKKFKNKQTKKTPSDYQRLKRFDVMTIGEVEKLIGPVKEDNVIKYIQSSYRRKFEVLHAAHISIGHGGRNRMEKEVNSKFKNIQDR